VKAILALTLTLVASAAMAETIKINNMDCASCEKQIQAAVCKNKDMSSWFKTCTAKVVDAKARKGELNYTPAEGKTITTEQMAQIEKAIASTGKEVAKN